MQTIRLFPIHCSRLHSTPYPAHLCKDSSAFTCPISTQGKLLLHKGTPTVYKELSNDNFLYLQYGSVCLKLFACNKKGLFFVQKKIRAVKQVPGEVFHSLSHHLWTTCFCSYKTHFHKGNVRLAILSQFTYSFQHLVGDFTRASLLRKDFLAHVCIDAELWMKDWKVCCLVSLGLFFFSLGVLYSETQHFSSGCSGRKNEKKERHDKLLVCFLWLWCDIVRVNLTKMSRLHFSPKSEVKWNYIFYKDIVCYFFLHCIIIFMTFQHISPDKFSFT